MQYKIFILFLSVLCLLQVVSATVTCSTINDITYNQGTTSSQTKSFQCTNSINASSVTLTKSGSASNYFTLDSTNLDSSTNNTVTKTFNLNFDKNGQVGNYIGLITFSDNSPPLSFLLNIAPAQSTGGCQINPSLVSYTQQVQQGTKMPLPKITFNPIDCPSQLILSASSVNIQGGVITPNGQKPVFISSVESNGVSIQIDTEGLNSQTYNSKLSITAFGKSFEVPFSIIVTGGTSSSGTFDVNNLPSCSLTSNVINKNSTNYLVCTGLVPDISIDPIVDPNYIIGMGGTVDSTQFRWGFMAKDFGSTTIKAQFKYLGLPVGNQYSQVVSISSSGSQVPGTSLKIISTPDFSLLKNGDTAILQLVENSSNSLVENPTIEVNAIPITNVTGKSFFYKFESNKNYTIRGSVPSGYNDILLNIVLSEKPLTVNITPSTGNTRTYFTITTNENATIYINGELKGESYSGLLQPGDNLIKAIKEGFTDFSKNISIESVVEFYTSGEFKKGIAQHITTNKITNWTVYYQKDTLSTREIYNNLQGMGTEISFTPDKDGIYTLDSSDGSTKQFILTSSSWKPLGLWWVYWALILIGLSLLIFIIKRIRDSSGSMGNVIPYAGGVNTG